MLKIALMPIVAWSLIRLLPPARARPHPALVRLIVCSGRLLGCLRLLLQVMVQYANECAKTVLEHTHCQRAVAKIVEMSNGSRSKVLRKTCMECVLVVLQHWEYSQLEREIGAIQDVLKVRAQRKSLLASAQTRKDTASYAARCYDTWPLLPGPGQVRIER